KRAIYEVVDTFNTLTFSHTADLSSGQGHLKAANELIVAISHFNPTALTPLASTAKLDETIVPIKESITNGNVNKQIEEKMNSQEPVTWMFVGDSITHGRSATYGYDSVVGLFQKFLVEQGRKQDVVINTGVSEANTTQFLSDIEARFNKYDPDVVFIMFGTNDCTNGTQVSKEDFKKNLEKIISKVKAKNAIPVLRTPPMVSPLAAARANYLDSYAEIIRSVAEQQQVVLIDHYLEWERELEKQPYLLGTQGTTLGDGGCATPNKYWLDDVLHPSPSGQLNMAQAIIRDLGYYNKSSYISNNTYQFNPLVLEEKVNALVTPTDNGFKINVEEFKKVYTTKELISLSISATPVDGGDTKNYATFDLTVPEVKLEGLNSNTMYNISVQGHVKNSNYIVKFPVVVLSTLDVGEVAMVIGLSNHIVPREQVNAIVGDLSLYVDGISTQPAQGFALVNGVGDVDNEKFMVVDGVLKTKEALPSKNANYSIRIAATHNGQVGVNVFSVKTVYSALEDTFDVGFDSEESIWYKDPIGTGNFNIA
ncbi:MAG: SGNH/GDSL hydrolase family protein, partial [Niameybacter sp.]